MPFERWMTSVPLQVFSHYPFHPSPVEVGLFVSGESACPYLPGRKMKTRAFLARRMDAELYHDFMDAGFRRSGGIFYQPVCDHCRECVPIRVDTARFAMSKAQRRVWRRNEGLRVNAAEPNLTTEKFELYRRYLAARHARAESSYEDLETFLYRSPVRTLEVEYRTGEDRLIGVSLLDVSSRSLSSVYMFFDPCESKRSPGVFSAINEICWARDRHIPFYYLGFHVRQCAAMQYKAGYSPHQRLRTDGLWSE